MINLMSYDEIIRTSLISTLVLTGSAIGYFAVRWGIAFCIKWENKTIKKLEDEWERLCRLNSE